MRSRAVRRLQEPARWVPAAMKAMLFTPWSPHLNLPGGPRLQRPAYEEPVEAGTLPRFIEISTAPIKNPKSETLKSTPGDAEQSMQIPDPQPPKPARPLSPAEREDSNQKLQRPAEVNTVLATAGGDSRLEISTLTNGQEALHTAKVNERLIMDKFGVVEVVDRPQLQQVLSTRWVSKTETGWILQGETCGTRI